MATKATDWKKGRTGIDLQVPSGNTCKARRFYLDVALRQGIVPNSLMPIVRKAVGGDDEDLNKVMGKMAEDIDLELLNDILGLVDAVVVRCVIEPEVLPSPTDERERKDDVLYVDEVDMEDKMFIFNWSVGGTADLEQFREQYGADVGNVPQRKAVERPAKRTTRRK